MDLVGKYGSDAFRLGILRGRSAGLPQAFSEDSVVAGRNLANKLWNISRLIQSWIDETADQSDDISPATTYDTDSMGEDWICRELDALRTHLEKDFKKQLKEF